jgi:segregation and condensation protein B
LQPEPLTQKEKEQMALVEAALYVTGKPLDLKLLGTILRSKSDSSIRDIARRLCERYQQENSSIQIMELEDGRYVMQLRPEYVSAVKRLATRQLLTPGPLKTLSFIALKQPISQAYIVKVRGKLAYGHVKQLKDAGLILDEKSGRTKVLRTSETFADYFNLSHDVGAMKRQLQKLFKELNILKPGESIPAPNSLEELSAKTASAANSLQ